MSDQFLAEIRLFPFNFAPTGWATCQGQLMPISQNTALFSLLGTQYGGDGQSTFALPNLQGNVPIGQGQGAGLSQYYVGQEGGTESVTLLPSEIPSHSHTLRAHSGAGEVRAPGPGRVLASAGGAFATSGATVAMSPLELPPAGGNLPHNNMMPFLALTFCIALQGIFPPRQ